MGTRVEAYIDFHLADEVHREPRQLLSILSAASRECSAIDQYWIANGSHRELPANESNSNTVLSWEVECTGEGLNGWHFTGPGSMSIWFGARVACIDAAARWRGFLTILKMRQIHRPAFASLARAVGATRMFFVPDYAVELVDAMFQGKSFEECVELLQQSWGPPQPSLDEINQAVIADCEKCPPQVWYLESL